MINLIKPVVADQCFIKRDVEVGKGASELLRLEIYFSKYNLQMISLN